MKKFIALFSVIIWTINLFGQNHSPGLWFSYTDNLILSQRFNLHNEVQYRTKNTNAHFEQLLIRNGIGFNISPENNNILLGHAFIASPAIKPNKQDRKFIREHRIYQQFMTKQKFGRVILLHRYRFEQRFLENDFKLRFRYFSAIYVPLNKKSIEQGTFYTAITNELFINTNESIFDRNRLYGAVGYAFTDNIKIELGVMTQFYTDSNKTQFQLSLFNNIAFKHHK